jgi:tellurite resistance protein
MEWVPSGVSCKVQDFIIDRGMVYLGSTVHNGWHRNENCLIDPSLPVDSHNPDFAGESMSYYPSYSQITPQARAAYLHWLAEGAVNPDANSGYVFLYFYGLEYRLLKEKALSELDEIAQEVIRLRKIYADKSTFGSYADRLLDAALFLRGNKDIYLLQPRHRPSRYPRVLTSLALGQAVQAGAPISADWMLHWIFGDPETNARKSTLRAYKEFRELFRLRFQARYPEGFFIKPNNSRLKIEYRAASASFNFEAECDMPDVSRLKQPLKQATLLFDNCCDALDRYSRAIAKLTVSEPPAQVLALLRIELAVDRIRQSRDPFLEWLRTCLARMPYAVVGAAELARQWVVNDSSRLNQNGSLRKKDAEALCGLMDLLKVGMEPDIRLTSQNPESNSQVILFKTNESLPGKLSPAYWRILAIIRLIATVAHADNEITTSERDSLLEHIRKESGLTPIEVTRLTANSFHLLKHPLVLREVKKELDGQLGAADREQIARLVLLTAVADGHFVPAETKILKKIYALLGLDPGNLFRDLHALGADTDIVTVQPANPGRQQFVIPRPPEEEHNHNEAAPSFIQLDPGLIERKLADTQRASALLRQVFQDEHEPPSIEGDDIPIATARGAPFEGLSHAQARLLQRLLEKRSWTHEAYRSVSAEFNVMPEGTLESINEWAIDRIGDILIEAGEAIEIYHDVWQEYLDEQQTHQT